MKEGRLDAALRSAAESAQGLVEDLTGRGLDAVEIFLKVGRTRRWELDASRDKGAVSEGEAPPYALQSHATIEEGWALRAGDHRGSCFSCGTGAPPPGTLAIETSGTPLRLPHAGDLGPISANPGAPSFAAPFGEAEAFGLLRTIAQRFEGSDAEVRFLDAKIEDGSSRSVLLSSKGVQATSAHHAAWLRIHAAARCEDGGWCAVHVEEASREPRRWRGESLADRLVDLARLAAAPPLDDPFEGPATLAPVVSAGILATLLPAFCEGRRGPRWHRLLELADDTGSLASTVLNITDDGRLAGGLFEASTDGEGVPTRRVALVERGVARQPLLPWWSDPAECRDSVVSGCCRRLSWRSQPEIGPSHLYLAPSARSPAELVEGMVDGVYLLLGEGLAVDWSTGKIGGLLSGFLIRTGQPPKPFRRARLRMPLVELLRALDATGRDLTFPATPGTVGSPTTRFASLTLH